MSDDNEELVTKKSITKDKKKKEKKDKKQKRKLSPGPEAEALAPEAASPSKSKVSELSSHAFSNDSHARIKAHKKVFCLSCFVRFFW